MMLWFRRKSPRYKEEIAKETKEAHALLDEAHRRHDETVCRQPKVDQVERDNRQALRRNHLGEDLDRALEIRRRMV